MRQAGWLHDPEVSGPPSRQHDACRPFCCISLLLALSRECSGWSFQERGPANGATIMGLSDYVPSTALALIILVALIRRQDAPLGAGKAWCHPGSAGDTADGSSIGRLPGRTIVSRCGCARNTSAQITASRSLGSISSSTATKNLPNPGVNDAAA